MMAFLFSLQYFPSVTADSCRFSEILTALDSQMERRRDEGKALTVNDATGFGSELGNQPHADKMRSSSHPTQRMSLTFISIVFVTELIKKTANRHNLWFMLSLSFNLEGC